MVTFDWNHVQIVQVEHKFFNFIHSSVSCQRSPAAILWCTGDWCKINGIFEWMRYKVSHLKKKKLNETSGEKFTEFESMVHLIGLIVES